MKTHRPWQPRLSRDPLFNPFAPSTDSIVQLDHIEIAAEEAEEEDGTAPADPVPEQRDDRTSGR